MLQTFFIFIFVFVCFIIENVFAEVCGRFFKPNLLIILIVFFNLFRGIRYSISTALIAGILKDCLTIKTFGIHVFSFTLCAYLTTFIKMYFYQVGSDASRTLIVFLVTIINLFVQYILNLMFAPVQFGQAFIYVFLPEILATTLSASYVFKQLRKCALKFFA